MTLKETQMILTVNYLLWQILVAAHFAACYVLFITYIQPKRRHVKFAILYLALGLMSIALIGEPMPSRVIFFVFLMLWTIRLSIHVSDVITDIRMQAFRARRENDVKRTFWGNKK